MLNRVIKPAIDAGNTNQSIVDAFTTYSNASNQSLVTLILNYSIIACISIFLALFFGKIFNKYNCLKFATISLVLIGFAIYMLQIALQNFVEFSYLNRGYSLAIGLTSLLVFVIGIICFIYLLLQELKCRKNPTNTEQVAKPIIEPSSTEPQAPTQE